MIRGRTVVYPEVDIKIRPNELQQLITDYNRDNHYINRMKRAWLPPKPKKETRYERQKRETGIRFWRSDSDRRSGTPKEEDKINE